MKLLINPTKNYFNHKESLIESIGREEHIVQNMHIVVILVNYNGMKDTIECIESIEKSTVKSQIVVVDNASKENEAEKISQQFPKVKTIRSETNGGFSAGNNIGIQWALEQGYEYIALLNNDTVIAPNMLELLCQNTSDTSVSTPKMLYFSKPNIIWYGGGYFNKKTGNVGHEYLNKKDPEDMAVRECDYATGCCIMIPSSVFKKTGLLDERFFMYCEDSEFCLRLKENGIGINYVPAAKLWHKIGQSTGGAESALSMYYITRNRILYLKDYKQEFEPTALAYTIVTRIIRMIQMIVKGKPEWKAFWKGISDGIKGVTGKVDLT